MTSTTTLTAADIERGRTWAAEIAATALPEGTTWQDAGDERIFSSTGGLSINLGTGAWFCHAESKGGYSPIGLIRFIKDCSNKDAVDWLVSFLGSHPGTGAAVRSTEDGEGDAATGASRLKCEALLAAIVPVEGTPAEAYLRGRGLEPPYPDIVGFVPYARLGESGLVVRLQAHDRLVGIQVLYLDPQGRKSTVVPLRRRFNLEKSPGAGFLLRSAASGPLLVCEGLEDALSLAALELGPVLGLPGIGSLKHLELPTGTEVVVFRDGDAPGSAADKALITGADHLLLDGVQLL